MSPSATLPDLLATPRSVLLEHELLGFFAGLGLRVPAFAYVPRGGELEPAVAALGDGPAVVKVVSERILHKTDVGGVAFVDALTLTSLAGAIGRIEEALPAELVAEVQGWLVEARVPFVGGLGRELLLGLRDTPEFGPVVTVGFGGTAVEALSEAMKPNQATVLLHPALTSDAARRAKLAASLFGRWVTGGVRGVKGVQAPQAFVDDLERWIGALDALRTAVEAAGRRVEEVELNPLVWSDGWVPVDALARLGEPLSAERPFPLANLQAGLHPESVALVGVSPKMNIGRIILRVMLDNGYPVSKVTLVRDDVPEIDGARCVKTLADLPKPVDLLVLAIGADGVPDVLAEVFSGHVARTVLLIPGGMGETEGGRGIARRVDDLLATHAADPQRPVLVGNNSLGLVSRLAHFDSLFIPKEKLPRVPGGVSSVALVSQSGAYMITRLTHLDTLAPDYQLSIGNQVDARFSHFVEALADRDDLTTLALYVEGFQRGDGARLGAQIARLVCQGRDVVVYKGGRSALGQAATAGHTASVAGDYRVFEELMHDVGAFVAGTFTEFVELTRLSSTLHAKGFAGRRAALMSNAGYETVGMADNHRGARHALVPAVLATDTVGRIRGVLEQARIASLINVTNPLDITPMANDGVHLGCMEALLADPGVDVAVFANVPLTPNVQTLPRGLSDRDVFDAENGYGRRVVDLFARSTKPFVVVIDAGRHYDDLVRLLEAGGVPVFRSADRATTILGRYVERKLFRG